MLHIVYHSSSWWNYIVDGLRNNENVRIIKLEMPSALIIRIIRKALRIFNIYTFGLYYEKSVLKQLVNILPDDQVLFLNMDVTNCIMQKLLVKNISINASLYCWLSNSCLTIFENERIIADKLGNLKNSGITCLTFDRFDSEKYNLQLFNQIYRYPDKTGETLDFEYDFYFLGKSKGRKEKIIDVQNILLKYSFSVNFSVIEQVSQLISYEENISNILKSRCIVDIVQKNQEGLTFRPLEALFFKRKLITDYLDIVKYDFYNPQNIFIIGVDDWDDINLFLSSPFLPISKDIVDAYNINKLVDYLDERQKDTDSR
jgi:hypothetical protein